MKKLLFMLFLTPGLLFAFEDFEALHKKGMDLYSHRGENVDFAVQATKVFYELAKNTNDSDVTKKSTAFRDAAMSQYYVADQAHSSNERERLHEIGFKYAKAGMNNLHTALGKPTHPENTEEVHLLAQLYYWYGANLGKWGEAKGVANSLKHWPRLRSYMNAIIQIGQKEAMSYGAYRILGRAHYKLPWPLGKDSKSLNYLKQAHDNTIDHSKSYGISDYSINVIYYADILKKQDYDEEAISLLEKLVAVESVVADYNPERVPETLVDIQEAKKRLAKWK